MSYFCDHYRKVWSDVIYNASGNEDTFNGPQTKDSSSPLSKQTPLTLTLVETDTDFKIMLQYNEQKL